MKRLLGLTLTILMLASVLSACKPASTVTGVAITACVGSEPQSLDPAINQSADGATYIVHVFEGLAKVDKNLGYIAGAAALPTVSADGLTYTFKIKKNALWSDDVAVKASDFVYAWQRAVNPATASAYAYQLYYVQNAAEINSQFIDDKGNAAKVKLGADGKPGKFKYDDKAKAFVKDSAGKYIEDPAGQMVADPAGKFISAKADGTAIWMDDLGVKATDDSTLVVTLAAPCPYFIQIVAFPTLFPVRKDIVEKNPTDWASNPATYIGNGPYVLSSWTHKSKIVMTKSANYYDIGTIKNDQITFQLMDDNNATYAGYKNGSIQVVQALFPAEETPKLVASGDCKIFPSNAVYYYAFNVKKAPFDNVKVRKALSLSIDRQYIVDSITKGGQVPAGAFVALGMQDAKNGSDFRKIGGNYFDPAAAAVAANIVEAKKLLSEAGYAGGAGFPTFELKYNTSTTHKAIAEYIIAQWKTNLGINATLAAEDFPTLINDRNKGLYSVSRDGWTGDYNDPMTFLDLCTTTSGNNDSHYSNPAFDKLIEQAKTTNDPTKRMKAMHDAEKILMDDMPVMPIYFYTTSVLINKAVTGVVDSPLGYLYLMWTTTAK